MYRPLTGGWQNTAELETIWKLNLSLTLSGRLRWAISLVLIDAIKSKIENNTVQKSIDVLSRKEKLWKIKLFASHKNNLQCYS